MSIALWWRRPRRLTPAGPIPASAVRGRRSGAFAVELADLAASRHLWARRWSEATEGTGLAKIVRVPAGTTVSAPRLAAVLDEDDPDEPTRLVVEMRPGQQAQDYRDRSDTLALALDAAVVSVRERGGRWIELLLWRVDPLAAPYRLPDDATPGFLGRAEDGSNVVLPWLERGHMVLQGATGSGKSTAAYALLAGVAGCPDVQVAGVDPSGVLFKPWAGYPGQHLRASGIGDGLNAARSTLAALVDELDYRISLIPDDADKLIPTPAAPLLVVVLEEVPGLYRAADVLDRKIGAEVRGAVGRLIAEGRKAAIRIVLVAQRSDANVVDGSVRAQASLRMSFACDDDALAMLHPRGVIDGTSHQNAAPGIALLSCPQLGHLRLRAPALSYTDYVARVRSRSA